MTDEFDTPDDFDTPDEFDPADPYQDLAGLTGEEPLPPLEDPEVPEATPPRSPLLTGLIIGLLLVVVSIAFFQLLRDESQTTTTPQATDAPATSVADTVPPVTGDPTASTVPSNTGQTAAPGSFQAYLPLGAPIPIDDLKLAVDAVGPVELGKPAVEAIGRLLSSLGPPDEDSGPVVSTGAYGTCVGQMERIVRWGPFVAIVVIDDSGDERFGGYRLDYTYGGIDAPSAGLQTLSGLKAGNSVLQLESIYGSSFEISYEVVPGLNLTFQLESAASGALLLWGPVTSDQSSGFVLGIYAPDACGRFQ